MMPAGEREVSRQSKDSNRPEFLLQAILAPDVGRVAARCRHFGTCGGCQLQDVPIEAQLAAKSAMLVQVLQGAGVCELPNLEIHAAEPWTYRNRVRMRVNGSEIGYSRRASHDFLPIDECPILSPGLWNAAAQVRELVRSGRARWPASTVSFELFTDAEEQRRAACGATRRDSQ